MRISPIPIGIAIISTGFAVVIAVSSGAYKGINSIMSSEQTSDSDNESGPNVIGSHTPGYPIATTFWQHFKQQLMVIPSMLSWILCSIFVNLTMGENLNFQMEIHSESLP